MPRKLSLGNSGRLCKPPRLAYISAKSREQVKAILDRVLTWSDERQEDAASMLRLMEAQNDGAYRLSAEQAEEVRRRLADTEAETVTLDEFNEHVRRRLK